MNLVVVGRGRIGTPIALAARAAGHRVQTLNRSTCPDEVQDWDSVGLVILAAAPENRLVYSTDREFLRRLAWLRDLPDGVAVASVAAPLVTEDLRAMAGDRRVVRFMCSPAVPDPASLRFACADGDPVALERLQSALPGPAWATFPPNVFDRRTALFVSSAVLCSALARYHRELDVRPGPEADFLNDTLLEAHRMVNAADGDPQDAFDAACTPGGMTEQFTRQLLGPAPPPPRPR